MPVPTFHGRGLHGGEDVFVKFKAKKQGGWFAGAVTEEADVAQHGERLWLHKGQLSTCGETRARRAA
jgi:hypothetical protein